MHFEPPLDCQRCGACCREAYDAVEVGPRERVVRAQPSLVVARPGGPDGAPRLELLRNGPPGKSSCAALGGAPGAWSCRIYLDRPRTCRDFARGGGHCLDARRKLGLSPHPAPALGASAPGSASLA